MIYTEPETQLPKAELILLQLSNKDITKHKAIRKSNYKVVLETLYLKKVEALNKLKEDVAYLNWLKSNEPE